MSLFNHLPWEHNQHPPEFGGSNIVCLIVWVVEKDEHRAFAIMNNICGRGRTFDCKRKNNSGRVSFVDLDKLDKKSAVRILNGYKSEMPIMMWCAIHEIDVPRLAYQEVAFANVTKVVGTQHYFNTDIIKIKRRAVKRRKEGPYEQPQQW